MTTSTHLRSTGGLAGAGMFNAAQAVGLGREVGSVMPSAVRGVIWLIHLLISGLTVGATLHFLRRTGNRTIFAGLLVFAGVHVFLSALVYLVPAGV